MDELQPVQKFSVDSAHSPEIEKQLDPPLGLLSAEKIIGENEEGLYALIQNRHGIKRDEIFVPKQRKMKSGRMANTLTLLRIANLTLEGYPFSSIANVLSDLQPTNKQVFGNEDSSRMKNFLQANLLERGKENTPKAEENFLLHPLKGSMVEKRLNSIQTRTGLSAHRIFQKSPPPEIFADSTDYSLETLLRIFETAIKHKLSRETICERFGITDNALHHIFYSILHSDARDAYESLFKQRQAA